MAELRAFNERVEDAVRDKNGKSLRNLLRVTSPDATFPMMDYVIRGGSLPAPQEKPWHSLPDLVNKRFATAAALNANNWVDAFDHLSHAVTTFTTILASDTAWSMPAYQALCAELRIVAEQADQQLTVGEKKAGKLEEAERVLKRGFTMTNNDRRAIDAGSRRIGTLGIINQLLKVYFKLNNLRLCANLTRTVNAPNFPDFELYPLEHRVTYKFFAGRLHLYEDRCREAVRDLEYAFKHAPRGAKEHKRHILLYLIPAKILTGSLPSDATLSRYKMFWFEGVVRGIRSGDLRLFVEAMENHEEFFIRKALFLAVEKMRPLVYRSLLRQIARVRGELWQHGNRLPLEYIKAGFATCGEDVDRDEVECILGNLIYNGYVRGYISHGVGYLVLSKKLPFPKFTAY